MPKPRTIAWSTAEVRDGNLTVRLDGRATKKWVEHLESVLRQLAGHGGGPGEVGVSGQKVTVDGVLPGGEDDVRHLLESAIHQVNADLADDDDDGAENGDDDDRADPDRQMT